MTWYVAPSYQHAKIVKVDEEIHKAYITETCWKCGGSGEYAWFGTCFACGGSGHIDKWVKAYTKEELDKYVAAQEKAKERREKKAEQARQEKLNNSDENRKELLAKWGYDPENPLIWLVGGGSTFEIKDWLKEQGCKFCKELGWYSCKELDVPEGYTMVSINFMDVYDWFPMVKRFEIKENAKEIADAALATLMPESHSEYVGEVKERVRDLDVTLTSARSFDGFYGTNFIYTFDYKENVLIWITSSCKDIEVGDKLLLTGTIKEHETYKGVKQTKLSRCVIKKGA